jgi:hypothetical protein
MLHNHNNDLTSTTLHTSSGECWCVVKFTYTLTASFVTERELSEEELGALVLQVAPQIEEPVNAEGDSVDYEIKLITCEIGSLLISEGN